MSITLRNDDLVLRVEDDSEHVLDIVNKYDAFLEALSNSPFEFQRDAVKSALRFLISIKYADVRALAKENYDHNDKLQSRYANLPDYLETFQLADKKSVSVDLATGTGKSFVIYGLARILLAEGLVDKVLVLCPSLTIEEGLKDKFRRLSADPTLNTIIGELTPVWHIPDIKSANDPINPGDICVENIHAVYKRTGSSIQDSFKGQGERTLVLNDEAHHIFSGVDSATRKWLEFLQKPDFGFRYIVNFSGTPYIDDNYFVDVVFRYGLKQAIEEGVVKRPDYKLDALVGKDAGFEETYKNHQLNQKKYGTFLKPISIVVTEKIAACVKVWSGLVDFISKKESLSREEAEKKVIWIASGIPSGADGKLVKSLIIKPEKVRKENVALLKSVDDPSNPVEWIVSVSMLTEGWDVQNVFQIVPHENRAFNSKLLISQVLGRGLRVPPGLKGEVLLKVNNHQRWTQEIENLFKDILEIENRLSWGWQEEHKRYTFPLRNLSYQSEQKTTESKKAKSKAPKAPIDLGTQTREWQEESTYFRSGKVNTLIENREIMSVDAAVKRMKIFLKDKDEKLSKSWTSKKLKSLIIDSLEAKGQETDFISLENFHKVQAAFGPLFRSGGQDVPRYSMKPDSLFEVKASEVHRQSFSEGSLGDNTHVFYTDDSIDGLVEGEQKTLWKHFLDVKDLIAAGKEKLLSAENRVLAEHLHRIDPDKFKTPWNFLAASSDPERRFLRTIFQYVDCFDGVIKNPDKGFYSFPYSYKPATKAKTHTKSENFNPDFFLKPAGKKEILVVEIKQDEDDSNKNKAKNRDGKKHFQDLNKALKKKKLGWKYHFYFLSPNDYPAFFQAIKKGKQDGWVSNLMSSLEK